MKSIALHMLSEIEKKPFLFQIPTTTLQNNRRQIFKQQLAFDKKTYLQQ